MEKNIELALKWWKLAAIQNDPGAQFNLGTLYLEGASVTRNYAEAAKWYLQSASRGHLQAQANLGLMYWEGKGVEKDLKRAYYWLSVAAEQGDDEAPGYLKRMAGEMSPDDVKEADAKAKEWMKTAKKMWR